jgi:uncharacterized protein YjbJ (UPF0337 family)
MDENRVAGTAKNVGGKAEEEGLGRIAGDAKTQLEGQARQVAGAAEHLYGQAKDAASSATDIVRMTIEEQPYKAVAIALAIGWLLGRTHRPL